MTRPLREADVEAFREELSRVATALFARKGFGGVTMRALAAELGVSPMTPYGYFRNKNEIFQAVRTEAFRRFGLRIEAAVAGLRCPIERLRAIGREYLRFGQDEPHAYRIMFQLDPPQPSPEQDPAQEQELRRGWQVLHDACAEGVRLGLLRGDPITLAHLAWVPMHGLVTLHLSGHLVLGGSLEALAEPMLENLFHGFAARPLPKPKKPRRRGAACTE
jgi:AcrR family transcriptional regulator